MSCLRSAVRLCWISGQVCSTHNVLTKGSGILSYMCAQAGAKSVIALEASSMADKIQIVREI